MAKLTFGQFFIVALVFSAVSEWPHAEAECDEVIKFENCNNKDCVAKCKGKHGRLFRDALCAPAYVSPDIVCFCLYDC